MSNPLQTYHQSIQHLALTADERHQQWAVLSVAIKQQPMEHWPTVPWTMRLSLGALVATVAAMIILVLTGGSVAVAAQTSLPGDVFYPLKVHLIENVRSVLAITPSAKAAVALQRVQDRLSEAVTLQQDDRLSDRRQQQLSSSLTSSSQQLERATDRLEQNMKTTQADDLNQRLEDALQKHRQELSEALPRKKTSTSPAHLVTSVTNDQQRAVTGKRKAVENVLREVRAWLDKHPHQASAQQQLDTLSSSLAKAQAQVSAGNLAQAFQVYQQTLRQAQALKRSVQQTTAHPTPPTTGLLKTTTPGSSGKHQE